jgi:hypothetical protein
MINSSGDGAARSRDKHTLPLLIHEMQELWLIRDVFILKQIQSDQNPTMECATVVMNPFDNLSTDRAKYIRPVCSTEV